MTQTLDLDLLRTLVTVVDAGGFTAAAERLGRTQAAVSMQVKRLEAATGRRLLARGRAGPQLTPDGERLVGYARRILALHDEALGLFTPDDVSGRVRLGTPDDYVATYLPFAIARFAETHPKVEIEIHCDLSINLEAQVRAGDLDLAIVTREPGKPAGRPLRRDPIVWCAAADHRPELVDPLPLAVYPDGCRFRPFFLAALQDAGRPYRIAYTSANVAGIHSAVDAGLALTCLSRNTVPANWRILGAEQGLPALSWAEIDALEAPRPSRAARRLSEHLAQAFAADFSRMQR